MEVKIKPRTSHFTDMRSQEKKYEFKKMHSKYLNQDILSSNYLLLLWSKCLCHAHKIHMLSPNPQHDSIWK